MEAVIFCGIQATGKSTFYKDYFLKTHIRISLDMLNTRNKESILLKACLTARQSFVIDNTNPTVEDRAKYIEQIRTIKDVEVIGYYFASNIKEAIARNETREGKEKIPVVGIKSTHAKLRMPLIEEGFDKLYYVKLVNNTFEISNWDNEI